MDFTIEVERSLRVLDGGVVILDGSAGVQAQTLTVWRQADGHNEESNAKVPRIIYINKMDKQNCNLDMSLTSIKDKLGCEPILTQVVNIIESTSYNNLFPRRELNPGLLGESQIS